MGIIFLLCDIIIRLLIGIIPLRMMEWNSGRNKKGLLVTAGIVCMQGGIYFVVHYLLLHYVNFVYTIRRVFSLDFSYAELTYFTKSVSICFIFSLLIGFALQNMLNKGGLLYRKKNLFLIVSWSLIMLFAGVLYFVSANGINNLLITEVCSNNRYIYIQSQGSYCDYIELKHTGLFRIDGENVYLSDDRDDATKMKVDNLELAPGEYYIVGLTEQEELSISKEGEYIYLFNDAGLEVDSIYSMEQEHSVSYSWMEEKKEWELRTGTPGENNELSRSIIVLEGPHFSHKSGFYEEEFELTLSAKEDTDIYYTLDGSIPTKDSLHYEKPIYVYDKSGEENVWRSVQNVISDWKNYTPDLTPVDKAFIVRAAVFDKEGNQSEEITATYFINKDKYADGKVISLVANPEDLFGDDGIYVSGIEYDNWYLYGIGEAEPIPNFRKNDRDSEIPASFQLFEGESVIEQNVGIRIQGGSSKKSAIKRFSVIARKEFSNSKWFTDELFANKRTHAVVLREGFVNAMSPYLVQGRSLTLQEALPVEVFLNGEYWYTTYMQEKICGTYLEEIYGLQEDNAEIVKNGISEDENVQQEYNSLCDFVVMQDMSVAENYEWVCSQMDMQSFIDFICVNTYLCNLDWDDNKNYVLWKSKEISDNPFEDGRFRWILYDMDALEWIKKDVSTIPQTNAFSEEGEYVSNAINKTLLYSRLKENQDFCKQFVISFMDIVNTCFFNENVSAVLQSWNKDITWYDGFFEKRTDYVIDHLKEEFELKGTCEKITIFVEEENGGTISVNTTTLPVGKKSWEGYYFTDYPITLSVVAAPGYHFVGWKNMGGTFISSDDKINVEMVKGGVEICAVFEKEK